MPQIYVDRFSLRLKLVGTLDSSGKKNTNGEEDDIYYYYNFYHGEEVSLYLYLLQLSELNNDFLDVATKDNNKGFANYSRTWESVGLMFYVTVWVNDQQHWQNSNQNLYRKKNPPG